MKGHSPKPWAQAKQISAHLRRQGLFTQVFDNYAGSAYAGNEIRIMVYSDKKHTMIVGDVLIKTIGNIEINSSDPAFKLLF